MTPPKRQWVDVNYVVDATGLSKFTIYKLVRLGQIPAVHTGLHGRTVRFEAAAIDKWMQSKASA